MATARTTGNEASVDAFMQAIGDPVRRRDAIAMASMMKKAARCEPKMRGEAKRGSEAK